uniref:Uncharacterized protein n=1 Tax=Caenorhabditis japonica TaxID=281687 RepID=A0A8R1EUT2_CAEJA
MLRPIRAHHEYESLTLAQSAPKTWATTPFNARSVWTGHISAAPPSSTSITTPNISATTLAQSAKLELRRQSRKRGKPQRRH